MNRIKTICCECKVVIHDGPQLDHEVSHGFCRRCLAVIIAFIEGSDDYDREHAKQIKSINF